MEYISIKEASEKWNITTRRIQVLCTTGRIDGAHKHAGVWFIPIGQNKPEKLKTGPKKSKSIKGESEAE